MAVGEKTGNAGGGLFPVFFFVAFNVLDLSLPTIWKPCAVLGPCRAGPVPCWALKTSQTCCSRSFDWNTRHMTV
jgi:hypothetical protein